MTSSCTGAARAESRSTGSRAYKKNDQVFVEQKNGAVVRRLVGYGRFQGVEAARALARLFAAARGHNRPSRQVCGRRPNVCASRSCSRPAVLIESFRRYMAAFCELHHISGLVLTDVGRW